MKGATTQMSQNHKLVLSYDGTDFHGWQRQPQRRTVQGVVEDKLKRIIHRRVPVIGAGRTDAGVHARAQVAHFKALITMKEEDLMQALNSLLPPDIRVISLERASSDFHARKMARSKIYQYRIFNSPHISPFLIRYVHHWSSPLNFPRMKEAASLFVREADFSGFSSNRFLHPVRKVFSSELRKEGHEIIYTVEANGFLRYMVRTMVGTLLEIGKGRASPGIIEEIFEKKDRSLAGPTAPAKGLCLMEVIY
ncbi:MAG: tRNA pseudouridine(38-40) synthase TruA [Candidatus Aminicenantales bacterium]